MKSRSTYIAFIAALLSVAHASYGQMPTGSVSTGSPKDSVIIFESPRPLYEDNSAGGNLLCNSFGFTAIINDFGFGLGLYYRRNLGGDFSVLATFDFGSAKDPKEFGLTDEIKLNRIYVMPLFASMQYRLFRDVLSEGLRPYVTVGAGPAFVMTTDGTQGFFTALGHPIFKATYGGFLGIGANFGSDPKITFGASLKYYIIPYPAPGIQSIQGKYLTNFNAATLMVSYGFNF